MKITVETIDEVTMAIARRIGAAICALGRGLSGAVETGSLLAGAALVAYGVFQVYAPAGAITAGVLLIAGTLLKAAGRS